MVIRTDNELFAACDNWRNSSGAVTRMRARIPSKAEEFSQIESITPASERCRSG